MPTMEGIYRFCARRDDGIPAAVRRRAVTELAAIVAVAMALHFLFLRTLDGPGWIWVHVGLQLLLPMLGALTLRKIAGPRIFAAAAIMIAGMVASVLWQEPAAWARSMGSNAFVALAMVCVLGGDARAPTRSVLVGAVILAVAMAVAQVI